MRPTRTFVLSLFLSLSLCTLIFAFAPAIGRSQGIPWYTIPLPLPGGLIDAATGNLHLEIPLGSMPQRSGDPIMSKMNYDATRYVYYQFVGVWNATGPGWYPITGSTKSGYSGVSPSGQTCTSYGISGYPNGSVSTWSGFSFTDIHGTTYVFPGAFTRQVNCWDNYGHFFGNSQDVTSTSGTVTDGIGYTLQVSNYNTWTIYAADGTLVSDNTSDAYTSDKLPLEPNGNTGHITSYGGQGSAPNLSSGLPTFEGTACPAYPQTIPPTYTVNSTINTSSGSSATYSYTCTAGNVSTVINGTTYVGTISFLTTLAMPDGTSYSFSYDTGSIGNHDGSLLNVTLPAGGTISLTYTNVAANPPTRVATATFGGGTWTLSYAPNSPSSTQLTTTVTAPPRYDSVSKTNVSDKSVFVTNYGIGVPYLQTAQYYSGSSTLLKTVSYTYNSFFLPITITTTLNDTGQSSSIYYQYYNLFWRNYPTQKQETDFTGTIIRTTNTAYNPAFMKPVSVNVYSGSGSGSPISSTLYTYDEYSANYCKNGVPMLASFTGAYGHDDTNFGTSFTNRGNLTTIQRLISGTTYATTHMCYDTLGNVTQIVDANGNPTSFDYTDNWNDTYCIPSGTVTHSFPTTITDALAHRTKKSYFTCTTLLQSQKNENDIQAGRNGTTYTYDAFSRPLNINFPDAGQTSNSYPNPTTLITTKAMGTQNLQTTTILDGLGRVIQTQLNTDPDCASSDKTDTTYDALGRKASVSNPYCSISDPTYGITSYAYDALGRPTTLTAQDGSVTSTSYSGNTTTVVDPAGKSRKSQTDALARLTYVWEDPAGLNYQTTYGYDALDNLTSILQNGSRQRTFAYDSLSRLTSATNPESGAISYTYDNNGNVLTKVAPAPSQTGYATVTTSYSYDALNRLTQKSFSDGITPTVKYGYDAITPAGCTLPALTINNGIGKRIGMCDAPGSEAWSYDSMGRALADKRTTNAVTKGTTYTYNLDGSLATLTYPSGRIITYATGGAGKPLSAEDVASSINFATNAHYTPARALSSLTNGASLISTLYFNSRLQPCRISVKNSGTAPGSCTDAARGNILDLSYNFSLGASDNGNVTAITNNRDNTRSQNFTYDSLNRLATAQTQTAGVTIPNPNCWGFTFGYDPWGNLLTSSITGPAGCSEPLPLNVNVNTSNRIVSNTVAGQTSNYCYDASGNLIFITSSNAPCPTSGPYQYAYNAENQLTSAAGVTYTYDGDGKRVQKSSGKLYWYGMGSDPLAETDASGNTTAEYIFFGGKRIAMMAATRGTALPVQNASFEMANSWTYQGCGGTCAWNGGPIPSWTGGGSFEPGSTYYNLPLPDGNIVGWSNGGTISQTLTGIGLLPNTTYTLSVYVGHRLDGDATTYSIALQAGSTTLSSVNGSNSTIPLGQFAQVTLSYTTGGTVTPGDLSIVLTSSGIQIDFDKVSLTSTRGIYYCVEDHLGTSRIVTNASGSILDDSDFYPFGGERPITSSSGNNYKFTGKERDPESGLDNFIARYMGSNFGRFMSPDPLYIEATRLSDPQQLNLYSYVRNNPLSFTDPTGMIVDLNCQKVNQDQCARIVSYLNNRKNRQFKVRLGKDGQLEVVKDSIEKKLSDAEAALLGAINDPQHHATINVVANTGDASFGVHDSKGVNTVDLENLSHLNAASNKGCLNSGDVLAHEALDAYYSLSMGEEAADQTAAGLYPGLYGPTGNVNSLNEFGTAVMGSTYNQAITNGSGTERISIRYITPIPAIDLRGKTKAQRQEIADEAGSRVTAVTFVPPKQQ